MSGQATFPCGHARHGRNALVFKHKLSPGGTASRCRECHNSIQLEKSRAKAGALKLCVRLLSEGTITEGQLAKATGLHRIALREMVDDLRNSEVSA